MKRFFAFNVLVKLLLVLFITNSNAATVKGAASVYKVTMKKLELCTASTGVTVCTGAVVIGEGAQVIDIAAADAGAVAGSYGSAALLPLGTTYTHMRVTIDRKFVIKTTIVPKGWYEFDDYEDYQNFKKYYKISASQKNCSAKETRFYNAS